MTHVPAATGDPQVWLVTGATSGFGRTFAEELLADGHAVVATARRPYLLDDLAARHPDRLLVTELDLADIDRAEAVARAAVDRFGRIDVLVNNAGHGQVGAVEETTDRELRDLMDVHFFGPAALVRAVLPGMRGRGSGAIVQMSSFGGQLSYAGFSAYSAGKCALEGFSEALAAEVAPLGITVLIVEPGAFRTAFCGPGVVVSRPMPEYEATAGATRTGLLALDGRQPGDPRKAVAAIREALAAPRPPLRLPLGDDALDALLTHLDDVRAELLEWEKVGRSTNLA
ncbi:MULTISPECIES: SDR family NAD(P)-dependent oxidoreductase [Catenuloplanes]|uniref:NAD(P)-dependent dehydrogenase (Short-subunit alcohol dehydrogenase family) n=1 Tax=Catenuloplanes niger TaxID=587534 RepID=A0AAE3ZZ11_9ACTN|nr:SDR family NAD(P)-dependent oxidoreductase [Catenuloplanes niger]MDR7327572.1 NAD(P)-dependent dehydrogenase (short-subunit alcohol dehydrogenase family) [Catenuloplanes niger]